MYYLYRHIREDIDIPFYIGIGSHRKNRSKNFERAFTKRGRNEDWLNIVEKTNYIVDILFESDDKEVIYKKEKEFIELYQKRYNLVNRTIGGGGLSGFNHTEETKLILSLINKGENHPQYGTKAKCDTRLKQSLSKIGDKNVLSVGCICAETGEKFESQRQAAIYVYDNPKKCKKVNDIIKGRRKSHLGYSFRALNN